MRISMGHTFKLYNLYCCHCANRAHGSGELHFDMTPVDVALYRSKIKLLVVEG